MALRHCGYDTAITLNQSKEERDAKEKKVYIGNGKTVWRNDSEPATRANPSNTHIPPMPADDGLCVFEELAFQLNQSGDLAVIHEHYNKMDLSFFASVMRSYQNRRCDAATLMSRTKVLPTIEFIHGQNYFLLLYRDWETYHHIVTGKRIILS